MTDWNENDAGYERQIKLSFLDKEFDVDVCIMTEEEIEEIQREAYEKCMAEWPEIQTRIAEEILVFYNEEEKFTYGPEDPEESKEWWPEINTVEELAEKLQLETIVIPEDFIMNIPRNQGKRCVYVLFNRDWGGEDDDDNGVAVKLLNEEVVEVGYKDMAY